ncbi:CHAT domain-containing protein [Curvivirga sp.]|uniref:CHAT domain-containing protein n=1 Tax=Curvivirga sp. TaxID=2856848 RepID=UPI003B5C92FD
MNLSNWSKNLILVILSIVMAGCVSKINRQTMQGEFNAITEEEAKATYATTAIWDLYEICDAFLSVEKYSQFDDCFDVLERRSQNEIFENPLGTLYYNKDMVDITLHELQAEKYLGLGDFAQAIDHADMALAAYDRDPGMVSTNFLISDNDYGAHRADITALGVKLMALSMSEQNAQIAEIEPRLRQRVESFVKGNVAYYDIQARRWLSQYYYRIEDYERAYEFAARDDRNPLDFLLDGYIAIVSAPAGLVMTGMLITEFQFAHNFPMEILQYRAASKTGRLEEARKGFDKLLADDVIDNFAQLHVIVLHDRAQLAMTEGDMNVAYDNLSKAIDVLESQRSALQTENYKLGFVGGKEQIYADMVGLLVDQNRVAEAFEYAERAKARALVDQLAERSSFKRPKATAASTNDVLRKVQQLEMESLQVASASGTGTQNRKLQLKALKTELRDQDAELSSLISVDAIKLSDIQLKLSPNEALLEYYQSGDAFFAFAITRNSIQVVDLNGKGLTEDIHAFRHAIQEEEGDAYLPKAQSLYQRLITPVIAQVDMPNVTIVPHGPLHYLPWAALHDGNGFLIESRSFRLLPSASVLMYLDKGNAKGARALLALGNPDLGNPDYDLPGAEIETKEITRKWPGSRVLLREFATEAVFKEAAPAFQYLHLASHGEFDAENPLTSGMKLAAGNGEDGLLTVDELYDLNLDAELVTLSACETGLGEVANGDDVIGLTRGFLYAGARSINASLWPVSDEATAYLMEQFYDNLKRDNKAEALRKAQRATAKRFNHPRFWAAFQLTGKV